MQPARASVALRGLSTALARLWTDERVDTFVVVGEALFWARAVDEQLWAVEGYVSAREGHPGGRLAAGGRLASNAVAHGAAVCVTPAGLSWPITYPITYGSQWLPLSAILEQHPALHMHQSQSESYAEGFAGRPVEEPLTLLNGWFAECAQRGMLSL